MTNQVDANGYLILDKHVIVTLVFQGVSTISCTDFDMVSAIIFDLEVTKVDGSFRIEWNSSYGVSGFVTAKHMKISLVPTVSG